jgi:ADP-ribose pyrophosphatase
MAWDKKTKQAFLRQYSGRVGQRPVVMKSGKFLRLVRRGTWEYVQRRNCTGVVLILPLTKDGKTIFLEQYRIPVGRGVIEFPAGLVNDQRGKKKESLKAAAQRELAEETGYEAHQMIPVLRGPSSAASSSGILSVFLAKDLKKVSSGGGDASELFKIHEVPLIEAERWLSRKQRQGCLVDIKIYTGLYFLNRYNKKS